MTLIQLIVFLLLCMTNSLRSPIEKHRLNYQHIRNDMFSGIVEDMGTVENLVVNKQLLLWDGSFGEGVELTVGSDVVLEDAYLGCSIAVNGVCLTVTSMDRISNKFTVGLAPETLRRTNLDLLKPGNLVNLERALKADSRNSGHFVQGHVDCAGTIANKWMEGDSLWVNISVPHNIMRHIVPKGFISIDGTSLTICDTSTTVRHDDDARRLDTDGWFTIMLITHTQNNVILPSKRIGEKVNIEVDVLSKMVERSMASIADSIQLSNKAQMESIMKSNKELSDIVNKLCHEINEIKNALDR